MRTSLKRHLIISTSIGAVVVGLMFGYWFVVANWQDAHDRHMKFWTEVFWQRDLFPRGFNILQATAFFYLLLLACAVAVAQLFWPRVTPAREGYFTGEGYVQTPEKHRGSRIVAIIALAVAVLCVPQLVRGLWENDEDLGRSYASATSFMVNDIDHIPSSLSRLADGATETDQYANCKLVGKHDVFGCIGEGDLPDNWERRVSSARGARIVMSRSSGLDQNTNLMTDTLVYLYNEDGSGNWTAIRDGSSRQPLSGIVSYDGANAPKSCLFTGDYAINKSFAGKWQRNLHDQIANDYRDLFYGDSDMWGFCRTTDNPGVQEPVIVIPVVKQVGYAQRTTLQPAGVLEITGSPSGEPVIRHIENVKPGVYPGPVYPASIVAEQRKMTEWAAGRGNKNRYSFGYETTTVETQTGNDGNYLLRNKEDGRLYWVTPLKPRSSDSQQLVAYSITKADEVASGELNHQFVYVLNNDDPRIVNLEEMEARVSDAIRRKNAGFFTGNNPGSIVEFLPVSDDTWQVYAELQGRVVYRIEVPSDSRIQPTVVPLDDLAGDNKSDSKACSKALTELSDSELVNCLGQLTDELRRRQADSN